MQHRVGGRVNSRWPGAAAGARVAAAPESGAAQWGNGAAMSGFFGSIMSGLGGLEQHAPAAQNMLSDLINQHGGMEGLMDKLNQSGMAQQVQGWVENGPAGAAIQDITKVFPPEQIEALAEKHGVPASVASGLLAQLLPHAVAASGQTGDASDADNAS